MIALSESRYPLLRARMGGDITARNDASLAYGVRQRPALVYRPAKTALVAPVWVVSAQKTYSIGSGRLLHCPPGSLALISHTFIINLFE
jgi:hypothetical protein